MEDNTREPAYIGKLNNVGWIGFRELIDLVYAWHYHEIISFVKLMMF